jgi:hypothetical protein
MTSQSQKGGQNSTNIQAEEITINQGLSLSDVRQVALDVYKANFYELAGEAKEIASSRAEEITEKFLSKLQVENSTGFDEAKDPDFQHALFTVQKEYARTGDEDLGDLLVDLLVDRSKQCDRNLTQIVLNECLAIAPKLTNDQLSAIAIIFLFKYTQTPSIGNHDLLAKYLDTHCQPFAVSLTKSQSCYRHLEYSGCASISSGRRSLENALSINYRGLFLKGFDKSELDEKELSVGFDERFFVQCINDSTKIQVRALSKSSLVTFMDQSKVSPDDKEKIVALFNLNKMTDEEIRAKCIELRPYMSDLFETRSNSLMQNISLTSVGIAIGHANIKRLVGEFSNLKIWLD